VVLDAQAGRAAGLIVVMVGDSGDGQPFSADLARQNGAGARRARQIRLRRRERVAAGLALARRCMDDGPTVRASLDRRDSLVVAVLAFASVDAVDRPVPLDIAGKVENEAVVLAVGEPRAATDHLHVEADRLGRAQHGDEIDTRRVEAGGQHVGVGETSDVAALERGEMRLHNEQVCLDQLAFSVSTE
jgi:hypothetical protein